LKNLISSATQRNWDRLRPEIKKKLTTRANKKLSQKTILPTEYFTNLENMKFIEEFLSFFQKYDWGIQDILYSVAINLLIHNNIYDKPHVKDVIQEYKCVLLNDILEIQLPTDEFDMLGLLYQCLLLEGEKNILGAYYTPLSIARQITKSFNFENNQTFLDPCCGSGAFMLSLKCYDPTKIFGIDIDPIAVMLAKFNMILKYPHIEFSPQVYCSNYLDSPKLNDEYYKIFDEYVSYIATNPPWGAAVATTEIPNEITTNETFSIYLVKAFRQLQANGILCFMLPESVLNVKCHSDIRRFLLENGDLYRISFHDGSFAGVATKFIDVEIRKTKSKPSVIVFKNGNSRIVNKSTFLYTNNLVFNLLSNEDSEILTSIKKRGELCLSNSQWALGIVTGDNKHKLKDECLNGYEPIYTGKEIRPYKLGRPKKYIQYDRSKLQQVAKEECYRAPEKLVYKFISNKLVFAYDNTKSLFLNSANIMIPEIPNMSIKTVMAFLNSELFHYMYTKLFGEIKVLKGNLLELPFPQITSEQNGIISSMVDQVLDETIDNLTNLDDVVYSIYDLKDNQIKHIREVLYGKTNS
jgi:type I restriction-modification system DNA methylase subunit